MKVVLFVSTLWITFAPIAATAQDWKEWHHSNPTYRSQPKPAPASPDPPTEALPPAPVAPSPEPKVKLNRTFLDQKFMIPAGAE